MSELARILKLAGLEDVAKEAEKPVEQPTEKTASEKNEVLDAIKNVSDALGKLASEEKPVDAAKTAAEAPAAEGGQDSADLIKQLQELVASGQASPEEEALLQQLLSGAKGASLDAALDKVAAVKYWNSLQEQAMTAEQQIKVAGITEDQLDKMAAAAYWEALSVKVASHIQAQQEQEQELAILEKIASQYPTLFQLMLKSAETEQVKQEGPALSGSTTMEKRKEEIAKVTEPVNQQHEQGDDQKMEEHLRQLGQKISAYLTRKK